MEETKKPNVYERRYVGREEFSGLQNSVMELIDLVKDSKTAQQQPQAATSVVTVSSPNIEEGKYDELPINPAWEAKAREIIGEALDHCELYYPKTGGTLFTVVIKKESSKAPRDYLERYHVDRRTINIEREGYRGYDGVVRWCNLVKQNLGNQRPITA